MDGDKQQTSTGGDVPEWRYTAEGGMPGQSDRAQPEGGEVTWTASEFIDHDKGAGWYAALACVALLMVAAVYWFTHDILSVGIILFVAVLLGITAVRRPRVLNYALTDDGLAIGSKFYPYSEFKSFATIEEGAFYSIMFLPLKRFMPSITVYYDPKDEDRIMGVLSRSLPMENRKHDVFDQLIKRIRF